MRYFLVACVLAVPVLYACGDSTAPESRAPRVGRYSYESEWTGTGTLTVTRASEDTVAATFDVVIPARNFVMRGPARLGFWNVDAYVLYGQAEITVRLSSGVQTFAEQYAHRIAWRSDGTAACTVSEVLNANRGQRPCTLRYLGP